MTVEQPVTILAVESSAGPASCAVVRYENGKETIVWRNEVLGIAIAGKYTP